MDGYVCLKVNECANLGLSKRLWTGESLKLKDCSDIVTPCIFHTLSSSREISWELCNVACVLSDSVVQVHCGAMFTCLVPFTIMCYLHLFLWNALNANGFSIKISRGEIYMIYCSCNAQKTWRNPDFPMHGLIPKQGQKWASPTGIFPKATQPEFKHWL